MQVRRASRRGIFLIFFAEYIRLIRSSICLGRLLRNAHRQGSPLDPLYAYQSAFRDTPYSQLVCRRKWLDLGCQGHEANAEDYPHIFPQHPTERKRRHPEIFPTSITSRAGARISAIDRKSPRLANLDKGTTRASLTIKALPDL